MLATIGDALHPEDEAALREPASRGRGELRQQLSNAMVALFKQYSGRGPTDCRTYLEPDLVIVVMIGGYTAAERTLFEDGKWHDVRQARLAWQDSMEVRFIDTIERLTQPHRHGVPERQSPGPRPQRRALRARQGASRGDSLTAEGALGPHGARPAIADR
jgi:uncharacterized protein YbcI